METLPMLLPQCPIHKQQMEIRESHTYEQNFCGIWYVCRALDCKFTTLFPSKELEEQLAEQAKNIKNQNKQGLLF